MDPVIFGSHRLFHLDLKGAPPRIGYIEKLFPTLKNWGATGILIEWEDTFPYSREMCSVGGLSESAAASGAPYSLEEAYQILDIARDCGLIMIPLIQTIGHLEFILKHPAWRSLREVPEYPSSMCPSHGDSLSLVRNVLNQALSLHKDAQYIHIGADEVWHMAICSSCSRRAMESKNGRASLFLDHIIATANFIKETHPHLKIIMWDDMLRNIDISTLLEYDIGSLVEPMVWHYNSSETFNLGSELWNKYCNVFSNIWVASAFKGATGSSQLLPVIKHHISNHEGWIRELEQHGSKMQKLMGIAITGWSRYDHYATLCELLPASLPSAAFCLRTWIQGGTSGNSQTSLYTSTCNMLGFWPDRPLPMDSGTYPGWQLTKAVQGFIFLRERYRALAYGEQVATWLNPWQIQNRYTNPMQIESLIPFVNELLLETNSLEVYTRNHMELVFYPPTVDEWIGTNVTPIKLHLQQLKSDTEFQLNMGCCIKGLKKLA